MNAYCRRTRQTESYEKTHGSFIEQKVNNYAMKMPKTNSVSEFELQKKKSNGLILIMAHCSSIGEIVQVLRCQQ